MSTTHRFTLADDDDRFLFIMHHLLAQAFPGSSIATFTNPEDALHHITSSGTEILITDHAFGPLTGTQLIEELRRRHYGIPIIMVSGDQDAQKEAITAGATEFLHKDLVPKHLIEHVKKLLQ